MVDSSTRSLDAQLLSAWETLLPGQLSLGRELLGHWTQPHRRYHDLRHLHESLDAAQILRGQEPLVYLALWFHDVVLTGRRDDEEQSARLASEKLSGIGMPQADIEQVCRLIMITRDHHPDPTDIPGGIVSDADLAILAASVDRYDESVADLRREMHVSDSRWVQWRRSLAVTRLRQPLFHSPTGKRMFQEAARKNLLRELTLLGSSPQPDRW